MGSGAFSTDVYTAAARYRAAAGISAFAYNDSGADAVHPSLDPKGVAVRESRDSDEHPNSVPIIIALDVTGSMRDVPRIVQAKLPALFGLLVSKGYVSDPQILFAAIGDATCDQVPLQVSQFESDNRVDEQLGRLVLEGGGGGQRTESYELAAYFFARHTVSDAVEKRGRRGYCFWIADETCYPSVNPTEVERVIGEKLQAPIPTAEIFAELTAKFDTYFILPAGSSYAGDRDILDHWRGLLGQQVINLPDLDALLETIGLTIGLGEKAIDLAAGAVDVAAVGGDGALAAASLAALAATTAAPDLAGGTDDLVRL
jgi:hypothetical protein